MGKLQNIIKGTRAVKAVPFRLADAPPLQFGEETDEHTMMVGLRVLTPAEIGDVYEKAMADAAKAGVTQWLDTHPLCRLHEMIHTVALAAVDVDSPDRAEPFFVGGAETVRTHPGMCGDNLAYLYEQHRIWQDECSPRGPAKTIGELVAMVAEEAARPENAPDGPFSRLRPSALKSSLHSICVLLSSSLVDKLQSSSGGGTSSDNGGSESESPVSPASSEPLATTTTGSEDP